jgi:hypothetical protein
MVKKLNRAVTLKITVQVLISRTKDRLQPIYEQNFGYARFPGTSDRVIMTFVDLLLGQ